MIQANLIETKFYEPLTCLIQLFHTLTSHSSEMKAIPAINTSIGKHIIPNDRRHVTRRKSATRFSDRQDIYFAPSHT